MVPASDSGDDLVGIGGPDEGFGIVIGLGEEAFDGSVEIEERSEDALLQSPLGQLGEEAFHGIKQDADLGV